MSLNNAKHIIAEIDGVRCTIVESGVSPERLSFLKELLEWNKFEVKVKVEEEVKVEGENALEVTEKKVDQAKYTIGVTDLAFNPVFAVYDRSLRTKDGQFVSPGMWRQETSVYKRMYWVK